MTFTIDRNSYIDLMYWTDQNDYAEGELRMIRNENGECVGLYDTASKMGEFFDPPTADQLH